MKKTITFFVAFLALATTINAQTIEKEKTDEFTGSKTITTSKEYMGASSKEYFRMIGIKVKEKNGAWESSVSMFIVVYPGTVTSLSESSTIYLKLDNAEVIELKNVLSFKTSLSDEAAIACIDLNPAIQKKLKANKLTKLRVSTTQKDVDIELVNSNAEALIKMIDLCNEGLGIK